MNYFTKLEKLKINPRKIDNGLVRTAKEEDSKKMARLYEESFPEHILVKWGVLSDAGKIREQINEKEKKWIVFDEHEIKGSCVLEISEWNKAAELARVVVKKEERGNGISTAMCKYMIDIAEEIGAKYLFAHARGPEYGMQRCLSKLGFRVRGIMPIFYVNHNGREVREDFVYMDRFVNGGEEEVESNNNLIPEAKKIYEIMKG